MKSRSLWPKISTGPNSSYCRFRQLSNLFPIYNIASILFPSFLPAWLPLSIPLLPMQRSLSKLVPQKIPNSSRRGGVRSWFRWGRRTDVTNSDSESRLDTDAPLSSSLPERASSASPPASRPLLNPAVDMLKRSEPASVPSSPLRQDWFSDTELEQNSEEVRRLQLAKPRRTRLTSEEMVSWLSRIHVACRRR